MMGPTEGNERGLGSTRGHSALHLSPSTEGRPDQRQARGRVEVCQFLINP